MTTNQALAKLLSQVIDLLVEMKEVLQAAEAAETTETQDPKETHINISRFDVNYEGNICPRKEGLYALEIGTGYYLFSSSKSYQFITIEIRKVVNKAAVLNANSYHIHKELEKKDWFSPHPYSGPLPVVGTFKVLKVYEKPSR